MVVLLISVQLLFSALWLFLVATGVDPIEVPLIASFSLWPLLFLTYESRIRPIRIIPLLTLIVTVYLAWLTGWHPSDVFFPLVSGILFFGLWIFAIRDDVMRHISLFWLGLLMYAPLPVMFMMEVFQFHSLWVPGVVISAQLSGLIYAIRTQWVIEVDLTSMVLLRINGAAMLIVPLIYFTNYLVGQHTDSFVLGIGGAVSAIALTRQQLIYRKRFHQAILDFERYVDIDQLTGCYTLQGFSNAICQGDQPAWQYICIDIVDFAEINDFLGFDFGDQLLLHITERLKKRFPDGLIGRFHGDYFVVAVPPGDWDVEQIEEDINGSGFDLDDRYQRYFVAVGISRAYTHHELLEDGNSVHHHEHSHREGWASSYWVEQLDDQTVIAHHGIYEPLTEADRQMHQRKYGLVIR